MISVWLLMIFISTAQFSLFKADEQIRKTLKVSSFKSFDILCTGMVDQQII